MIDETLNFLRRNLNKAILRSSPSDVAEDLFVFVKSDETDKLSFTNNSVSMALVRIEEEKILRQADPYVRKTENGDYVSAAPEIKLYLWVLLAARFSDDYSRALKYISDVIVYFQNNRVFNSENSPDMNAGTPKLIMELVAPSFEEQHKIWGVLQSPYLPSVLYKVTLLAFQGESGAAIPEVSGVQREISQKLSVTK